MARGASTRVVQLFHRWLLHRLSVRTHIQLPWCCQVGPGLYIGHLGRLVVHPGATIGSDCNLAAGVTIGATNRGPMAGAPIVGDQVWVGTNAVIVGAVVIGSRVLIAPNAFVNFDVPDDCIVMGNPGVIHSSSDAVVGYINNPSQR